MDDTILTTTSEETKTSESLELEKSNLLSSEGYEEAPLCHMSDHTLMTMHQLIEARLMARLSHVNYLYHEFSQSPHRQLRYLIRDVESGFEFMYYHVLTHDVVTEYHRLSQHVAMASFVHTEASQQALRVSQDRLQELLTYYISVAKRYIRIDDDPSSSVDLLANHICPHCGHTVLRCINSMDNIYVCAQCFAETYIQSDQTTIFKDIDRINFNTKHAYSPLGHIRDAVQCFQGLQTINPQRLEIIMEVLYRQCQFYHLSTIPTDPHCITRHDIYTFLEQERNHDSGKGLSDHYKDVNLLHRMMTTSPCPDISDYLDRLYQDFEIQEHMYESTDHGDRKNSLNVYYKLYKLLQRQGAPYHVKDFFFLKTQDVLDHHDEETRKVWNLLGWEWIETS